MVLHSSQLWWPRFALSRVLLSQPCQPVLHILPCHLAQVPLL